MTLLTLFTAPKAFTDSHIAIIQRNAIESWLHLGLGVEVILIGQENGVDKIAKELGIKYLPEVARNTQGTPLVSSIFSLGRENSQSPLLGYLNADILVTPELLQACAGIFSQMKLFLAIGQRWDVDIRNRLDFSQGWEQRLKAEVQKHGIPHPPQGSDYFVFPRELFNELPDFAIGRAGWDNWMIYHARQQGWPVVDLTPTYRVVHQNHDYSHLPGGKPHYDLEESNQNIALAGGPHCLFTILDANRQLIRGKVRHPRPTLMRIVRAIEVRLTPKSGKRRGVRWALARFFRRWRRFHTGTLSII